jgi:hypothetical protein
MISKAIDRVRSHAVDASDWKIVEMCDLSLRGHSGALKWVKRYAADNRDVPGLMWADACLNCTDSNVEM